MKEHFERQIAHRIYEFTRITFPGRAYWYRVHCSYEGQSLSFWMKRKSDGAWKIQPQLLADDIWKQEQAFAQAIQEREANALYH